MSDLDREFDEGETVWLRRQEDAPVGDGWGVEFSLKTDGGTESAQLDDAQLDVVDELAEGEVVQPSHQTEPRSGDGWGFDSDLDDHRSAGSVRPGGADWGYDASPDAVSENLVVELGENDAMQRSEALSIDVAYVADSASGDDGLPEQTDEDRRYERSENDSYAPPAFEEQHIDLLHEDRQDLSAASRDGSHTDSDEAPTLSTEHRDALRQYTGIGHHELNATLRGSSVDRIQDLASRSAILTEALERMPVHEGTVFRGSSTILDDATIARYEPGERVVENQYLSTTVDPDAEFGGNVLWIIDSKLGRGIEGESSLEQEHEVLFDRFAAFDVLAKDYDDEHDRWVIYMAET